MIILFDKRNIYASSLSIQYEQLERQLQDRINKKYNILDNRSLKIPEGMLKFMPSSGIDNRNNQSEITFEEPNTKPPYPVSNIPYSQGLVWE